MGDPSITAALVAVILVLKETIAWFMKKNDERKNGSYISLHPEVNRQIREVYESMGKVKIDIDEIKRSENEQTKFLATIAECLKKTAETQEKVAQTLEKIDKRQEIEDEVRRRLEKVG